ncbi:uncharacterized protein B0H18DRAFT_1212847 [Fomitopsis serialis]|uniref:uncharacterized protein n=1 Tax=Fomitopsis serialis TaxID=139415 RepID=UPI002008B880|nr:uncharacterized protein B0H18DRAFT_1212847 [Neoantrodia serialis]KAH9921746.1 hypothetical protein B0H18DRAFT_1212847 [Neoantrodia serialis]
MSEFQPSLFFPSPDDASHAQVTPSITDGHIDVDQSSADEQAVNLKRSNVDESSARGVGVTFCKLFDAGRWVWGNWWDARFQGTLPLALSARIPLEVFMLIIDAIEYQPTFAAVALVCATWYRRAMHKLYYDLEIRSRTSYNMLFKHCRASPRVKQWLATTCKLVVDGGCNRTAYYYGKNKSNVDNSFLQALPSALVGLVPRVRILHIENGRLCFIRTDFFLALSRFKSVKSLTLQGCKLHSITQLWRIVSAFPQLTDISINVRIAQQDAAGSHAGASFLRTPSHMRLRYLDIFVHEECMAMFVDWMARSCLCTSLADLTFRCAYPSMARTSLNKLLEAAGASLSCYCQTCYFPNGPMGHGDLSQNTALQSLDFGLNDISYDTRYSPQLGPGAAWTTATYELRSIFSAIRSRQLEHIKVQAHVRIGDIILDHEQPSAVLDELNQWDLHEVMSEPYFDKLKDVEVKMDLYPQTNQTVLHKDTVGQKLQAMFHAIFQPWSARGIVNVTWVRG